MAYMQMDKNIYREESQACPSYAHKIKMDVCQDYQMQGNAEFVPRVIEDELAETWILQCEACESMHGRIPYPQVQPEMNLE